MAGDYVPHSDGAFLEWAKPLIAYAAAHAAGFNIPQGVLPPIQAQLTAYETAFEAAQNPNRGKVDVLNKNETKSALESSVRSFIKAYIAYNPAVSDADKESMGLPLRDPTRTPVPPPSTIPEIELDSSIIRQVTVHFKDNGSEKRGKPAGVHGIELRWALLDNPPSSVEDLTKSAFDTFSTPRPNGSGYFAPTHSPLTKRTGARLYTFAPVGKITKATKGHWVKL